MKSRKQKNKWKKVAGIHVRVSVWMFVSYLVLSVAYSPEFLVSDIRHKWSALADDTITITGRVLGPPQKAVVTADSVCSAGTLSVRLDWADDENSQSFDVLRDGAPLVTGLGSSSYVDTTVVVGETYSYEVVSNGPMSPGSATSDPVAAVMPDECVVVFVPSVEIVSFQGKAISDYVGIPKTDARKPTITGTTNIPSAQVDFLINDSVVVSSRVFANTNGYWSFRVPTNLSYGTHTIFVTASDPANPSVTVSKSLTFRIVKNKSDGDDDTKTEPALPSTPKPSVPGTAPTLSLERPATTSPESVPLDYTLRPLSEEVYQGRDVSFEVRIIRLDPAYAGTSAVAKYSLIDHEGRVVATSVGNVALRSGESVFDRIYLPPYVSGGQYRLRAELFFGKYAVSREAPVTVLPLPILSFGGGLMLTYPDLLSRIGTISMLLLLLLLLWLSLFLREYLLYSESIRHITERNLIDAGFFGRKKRKGVSG
jgi:hypothetical protein